MNLILFGPPGAGKGTQSTLLVDRLQFTQISTGDLFRAAIKAGTPLGREARGYLDAGKLVPDEVTIGLVEEKLTELKGLQFILDGFPRNTAQADALERLLSKLGLRVDHAVFLEVPGSDLLGRLSGRRVCRNCGAVFHVVSRPPRTGGTCDVCGGDVVQRPDDREEVIQTRLDAYESSTRPLKDYYRAKGLFVNVDGLGTSEDVYSRLVKAVQVKR